MLYKHVICLFIRNVQNWQNFQLHIILTNFKILKYELYFILNLTFLFYRMMALHSEFAQPVLNVSADTHYQQAVGLLVWVFFYYFMLYLWY